MVTLSTFLAGSSSVPNSVEACVPSFGLGLMRAVPSLSWSLRVGRSMSERECNELDGGAGGNGRVDDGCAAAKHAEARPYVPAHGSAGLELRVGMDEARPVGQQDARGELELRWLVGDMRAWGRASRRVVRCGRVRSSFRTSGRIDRSGWVTALTSFRSGMARSVVCVFGSTAGLELVVC